MGKIVKQYTEFITEGEVAEPTIKPSVKPGETPTRRKSPLKRDKPSVNPRPKASEEEVVKKLMMVANKEMKDFLNKKYSK